jgi:hypothetical protein
MQVWVAVVLVIALGQGPRQTPRVQVDDGWVQQRVKSAVLGAKQRLERPECQRLLTDFQDADGRPLLERLQATALTASDYLFDRVWFVDGAETPPCQRDHRTAAFTSPGHQVVRICRVGFGRSFVEQSVAGEIVVIHEMLHTLGLSENPPSTREITEQVRRRCGGS